MSTDPLPRRQPQQGAALIVRRADGQVLCGARTQAARSWPGTMAFPGGSVDDDDDELPLWSAISGGATPDGKRRAAALRESLEEAGLLRVCRVDGTVPGSTDADANANANANADHGSAAELGKNLADDVAALVDDLRAGTALKTALRARRLVLDDRGLIGLGSWLTAEGTFEVTRYLLDVGDGRSVRRVAPLVQELVDVEFRSPRALVAGWRAGSVYLLPPIRLVLTRLAAHEDATKAGGDVEVVAVALSVPPTEPERRRRDLIDGVVVLDMRSPTLPPAVSTNCVVLGTGDVLLVDPATPFHDERARFDDTLAVILEGRRVQGVFLTHHHVDHVGDAARLRSLHGCPVYAHRETAARVVGDIDDVTIVDDGHVFELGARRFRCVFTPGHAPGHLCLFDDDASLLIAGDMVAGVGSILIDPPEGHMATYLAGLDRLVALSPRALIPAHGPLLVDATARLAQQKQHRLKREAMVRAAIDDGAGEVDAVVAAVYGADTPPAMFAFAARSVAAIVEKLVEDGAVVDDHGRWRAAATATARSASTSASTSGSTSGSDG